MKRKCKKILITTINAKTIISILSFVFVISAFVCSSKTEFVSVPKDMPIIVIDAGHGGVDGGCVGKYTKVVESELNLVYAQNLKRQLVEYGFCVVMTRKGSGGLYDEGAPNLKKSDMKKRKEIIENSNCDMVISIHMNSYVLESSSGSQVFYDKENKTGQAFAESLQEQIRLCLGNTTKKASSGDYYILNATSKPAALVECGFVSNKKEELLLQQKSYQDKFCYAILCGIVKFFGVSF